MLTITQWFQAMDTNKDGVISSKDFMSGFVQNPDFNHVTEPPRPTKKIQLRRVHGYIMIHHQNQRR